MSDSSSDASDLPATCEGTLVESTDELRGTCDQGAACRALALISTIRRTEPPTIEWSPATRTRTRWSTAERADELIRPPTRGHSYGPAD